MIRARIGQAKNVLEVRLTLKECFACGDAIWIVPVDDGSSLLRTSV
jgi:hypothetical protein